MNEVDVSEQELLEKCPEVLRALLKDHTRTAYEVEKAKKEGRQPAKDQWNIIWGTNNATFFWVNYTLEREGGKER